MLGANLMQPLSGNATTKKAANLSINRDLLAEARSLNINLSATLEWALTEKIRLEKRNQWRKDNREAIDNCNTLVEENGLFSDKHRVL
jgi:antitoxin CcdA